MVHVELPTKKQIEMRAYEIYSARGGKDGFDLSDWLAAENQVNDFYLESCFAALTPQPGKQPKQEIRFH